MEMREHKKELRKTIWNTQRKYLCHLILKWIVEPMSTGCFGCQEYKLIQKLIRQTNRGKLHQGLLNMVVWLQPLAWVQEVFEPEIARSCKNISKESTTLCLPCSYDHSLNICCWPPSKASLVWFNTAVLLFR